MSTRATTTTLMTLLLCSALAATSAFGQSEDRTAILKKPRIKETTSSHSLEQTFTVDLPMRRLTPVCKGQVDLEYDQYDTIARVAATLVGTACNVATAEFALIINSRPDDGELVSERFELSWTAASGDAFPGSGDYPIGAAADLVNVRVRQFSCTCSEDPLPPE